MNTALDISKEDWTARVWRCFVTETPPRAGASVNRLKLAEIRAEVEQRKEGITMSADLALAQRRAALKLLRAQAEESIRQLLGDRDFNAYRAFNHWWFREISPEA